MELKRFAGLILIILFVQACGSLRTELYREETLNRYQGACKLYKEGDYAGAGEGFEAVLSMDPDYGPAHAALGNLDLISENYPGALAHYREAIAVDPELEPDLQPFMMVAQAHKERAPLKEAGISLNQLYPLIMGDRRAEVEALLAEDIPLRLLANDTMGITPGLLGEMRQKIAETADTLTGSVRYRLFAGYLLFFGQTDDDLAEALISGAADEAADRERQQALVVLGQLHERRGDPNAAVDAYLSAVESGLAMTEAAHHLARVYRVDIETILPPKDTAEEETRATEPVGIEILTYLPPAQGVDLDSAVMPKDVLPAERTGSRNTF
jgi:tetratricopeptide (TPR) repeat protein